MACSPESSDEMRPEYDFRSLEGVVRGRYTGHDAEGQRMVCLEPDVAAAFPDELANEKSQLQNREQAMRILRARLLAVAQEQAAKDASDVRRSQVRTVDRSERIRTYNFPENRLNYHRVGFKAHNLDQVLDGELDTVIEACIAADQQSRLAEPSS